MYHRPPHALDTYILYMLLITDCRYTLHRDFIFPCTMHDQKLTQELLVFGRLCRRSRILLWAPPVGQTLPFEWGAI